LPEILQPIYFDFHWSQPKLWALAIAPVEMAMAELEWSFAFPVLASDPPHRVYDLTPEAVLASPESHPVHWQRVLSADTSFPLHVMKWRGRWLVMDGFHRLMKRKTERAAQVSAIQVPESAIAEISPDPSLPADFLRFELAKRDSGG